MSEWGGVHWGMAAVIWVATAINLLALERPGPSRYVGAACLVSIAATTAILWWGGFWS
jgi:hypothetical protein